MMLCKNKKINIQNVHNFPKRDVQKQFLNNSNFPEPTLEIRSHNKFNE